MKKIVWSVLFILGTLSLFAQAPKVKWQKLDKKTERKTVSRLLITSTDSEILFAEFKVTLKKALSHNAAKYEVVYYDIKDMKLLKREPLDLKFGDKNLDLRGFKKMHENTWVLSSFNNKKKQKNYLFVQSFDVNGLKVNGDRKMIMEQPYTKNGLFGVAYDFHFSYSTDSSKLLVSHFIYGKGASKEKFSVAVFDHDMNELWTKKITLPSNKNKTTLSALRVDNDGNLFFTGRVKNKKKGKAKERNYKLNIYLYTNKGADRSIKTIKLGKEFWPSNTGRLWQVKNGKLLYLVTYANGKKAGDTEFLIAKIDIKTGEIEQKKDYKFPLEWIAVGKTKKAMEVAKRSIARRKFKYHRNLVYEGINYNHVSGESTLFLEDFEVSTYVSGQTGRTRTIYTYKEIIIIKVDRNGELLWQNSVNRRLEGSTPNYYGILPILHDGKAYVFFNDTKKSIQKRKEGKPLLKSGIGISSKKKHDVVLLTFDDQGKMKESIIETTPFSLIYTYSYELNNDVHIVFGGTNRKPRMGVLSFK